jgi:hypothetical protein
VGMVPVLCAKTPAQKASQAMSEAAQLQAEDAWGCRRHQRRLCCRHLGRQHRLRRLRDSGLLRCIPGTSRSQELGMADSGGTHDSGTTVAEAERTSSSATLLARWSRACRGSR